ncbi:MAG: gp16 family protein [Leptolyngbyaceae cyanobacterium]
MPITKAKITITKRKPKSRRANLIGWIHQKAKQLKLDNDTYKDVLFSQVGKRSCSDMAIAELEQVNQHFERLVNPEALTPSPSPKSGRGGRKLSPKSKGTADSNTQAAKIRALWITLYRLGAVNDGSENAINSYCKRMTGMERLEWAGRYPQECNKVIEALKDWVERTLQDMMAADNARSLAADLALSAFREARWTDFNQKLDYLEGES